MQFKQRLIAVSLYLCVGLFLSALGQPAHASKAETLSGVVIAGGITCPMLKLRTGESVSLMGVSKQKASAGKTFTATGIFVRHSTCQQAARTFRVDEILNASPVPQ
ncbi:hypothetical protein [Pararhizobium sp. IMCC21322]|uniref:hypothetical protein n=1 Tax=Pararhizobium sp. IMCC21322 TaxID=3067903 RepID=UPI002741DD71|nr:hypothetical protein [Pararhizobium sp. IMCC21322]